MLFSSLSSLSLIIYVSIVCFFHSRSLDYSEALSDDTQSLSSTTNNDNPSLLREDGDSNLHNYFFPYLLGYRKEHIDHFFLQKWQQSPAIFKNTGAGTAAKHLHDMINSAFLDAIILHNEDQEEDKNDKAAQMFVASSIRNSLIHQYYISIKYYSITY